MWPIGSNSLWPHHLPPSLTRLHILQVYQSYDGLGFDEQQEKQAQIDQCKEDHAMNVLIWSTRIWYRMRHPPPEYVTDADKKRYRGALACIRLLLLDSMVRTGKVIKATTMQR